MKVYGVLPMAGKGSRVQPIAFSKELYPVVYKRKHFAISEFSIRAMLRAGASEVKLIVNPQKMDIAKYYSTKEYPTSVYFYESPSLPESCLFPIDYLNDDDICIFGLPDTLFSPISAYKKVVKDLKNEADITLGVFKVEDPSKYDSVAIDEENNVHGILVKQNPPLSEHTWGIWGANVKTLKKLREELSKQKIPSKKEKLLGVAMNSLSKNKKIKFTAQKISDQYFDIGTMDAVVKVNNIINDFKLG